MRLADLNPKWLISVADNRRIGFAFISPIWPAGRNGRTQVQTCFFTPTPRNRQRQFVEPLRAIYGADADVQLCKPACGWAPTPAPDVATWETISVTPSLDGSAGGNWHGFVTNGAIVGGV